MKANKSRYKITRNKFFDTEERAVIMRVCKQKALEDEKHKRITWVNRWTLIHLVFYSGLRVSEITDIRISDLKLNYNQPFIWVRNGKGGQQRDVYIDDNLAQHLREYIKGRKSKEYLFLCTFNSMGKKYTSHTLQMSFKVALKAAGLRSDLSIHSARHTYATFLYDRTGNDIEYVRKQLGHADTRITSLYAGLLPQKNGIKANMILNDND